jgi:hypothetical protein
MLICCKFLSQEAVGDTTGVCYKMGTGNFWGFWWVRRRSEYSRNAGLIFWRSSAISSSVPIQTNNSGADWGFAGKPPLRSSLLQYASCLSVLSAQSVRRITRMCVRQRSGKTLNLRPGIRSLFVVASKKIYFPVSPSQTLWQNSNTRRYNIK